LKKTSILFSSGLNFISPVLTYFIIAIQYGSAGINSYTMFISASAWFSALISIGLPKSLLLEKETQVKPITEYLAIVSVITLCSFSISMLLALALPFAIHGAYITFEFLAISLLWGLAFSIQDLTQSLSDKYKRYSQTFRISSCSAVAPILALVVDRHILNSFKSFLLLVIIIRICSLIILESHLLREASIAFRETLPYSDLQSILASCLKLIKHSFPYFIGRLATTSYAFASVSIIVSIFSPSLSASYFLSVRVISSLLTVFSGFFERYCFVSMTASNSLPSAYSQKLAKRLKYFSTFCWLFPLLVSVFALILYVVSITVPLNLTLSYTLLILIALVFALRLISLIVGTVNTALLSQHFYLIVSVGYYALCYSLLLGVEAFKATFEFYIIALCLIELLLLAINLLGLSMHLKDSRICRALFVPLTSFVVISLVLKS